MPNTVPTLNDPPMTAVPYSHPPAPLVTPVRGMDPSGAEMQHTPNEWMTANDRGDVLTSILKMVPPLATPGAYKPPIDVVPTNTDDDTCIRGDSTRPPSPAFEESNECRISKLPPDGVILNAVP